MKSSIKIRHILAIAALGTFTVVGCSDSVVGPENTAVTHTTKAPNTGFDNSAGDGVSVPKPLSFQTLSTISNGDTHSNGSDSTGAQHRN